MPLHRSRLFAAFATLMVCATAHAATPDWGTPAGAKRVVAPAVDGAERAVPVQVNRDARWGRVPGCARDIAAGGNGVVYVTGCEVAAGQRGASALYRWSGAQFVAHPAPGLGSAIATFGGNGYAVGGDAMLYSSASDGAWSKRGTPHGQPIIDVGAGQAGLWVVTSQPNGEGGNAISRAMPCTTHGDRLLADKDFCGWEEVPGAAMRIAVGATAWVVNAQGQIFEWQDRAGGFWQKRPGCFRDVAANGYHIYAVSCRRGNGDGNAIYLWNSTGNWIDTLGAGKRVGVDAVGHAWAITDSGEIWRLN